MYGHLNVGQCGGVRIENMKLRIVLQAQSSWQAQSKHLRIYVQIELSERGKVSDTEMCLLTKNNKQFNRY